MSSQESISPPATRQHEALHGAENAEHAGSAAQGRKKRVRNWTADDRAAHRVFERSRREAFKGRLTTLANLIPALQSTDANRLSKHVVLDESIALHKLEQQKLAALVQQVDHLLKEREELLIEVNRWRVGAGLGMREATALEPLPEPNTSPATTEQGLADPEDMMTSMQAVPLQSDQDSAPLASFEPIPPQMPPLNPPGVVAHTGATSPDWHAMGMGMSTQSMDSTVDFNDMFTASMVNYPAVIKPPGEMAAAPYIPNVPSFPQQSMSIINPRYAGDPRIYGQ